MNDGNENQIDFSTILEYYDSNDEILRINAANYISELRNNNIFDYLFCLLTVITDQESSQHIKNISIILSYKALELMVPTDQFCPKYQFIENGNNKLLSGFFNASIELFSTFPLGSGFLFSAVSFIIWEKDENNQIIQDLCQEIKQSSDLNFIYGALTGIEDLCKDLMLSPQQYLPILDIVFVFINDVENYITDNIKKKSMHIILNLILALDDVFSEKEIALDILKLIEISISKDYLKSVSYSCIEQIIIYYLPIFMSMADDVLLIACEDLNKANEAMDDEIIYSICNMISYLIPDDENGCSKNEQKVFEKFFPPIFEALFPITLNFVSASDPNSSKNFDISTLALDLISQFIKMIPDFAFAYLKEQCIQNFFELQNGPIYQEMICNFVSFFTSFCEIACVQELFSDLFDQLQSQKKCEAESFSEMIIQIIIPLLNSSSNYVINAAVNLLQSIVLRTELDEELDDSFYIYFFENIFEFFKEEQFVTSKMCNFIEKLLPPLENREVLSQVDLVSTIANLIEYYESSNNYLHFSIFECISSITAFLDENQFHEVFDQLLQIVIQLLEGQISDQNESDILYMFRNICLNAIEKTDKSENEFNSEELFSDYLDLLYSLFTEKFNQTQNNEYLDALTFLACATPNIFEQYLEDFLSILIDMAQRFLSRDDECNTDFHKGELISEFASLMNQLSKYFDLQRFIDTLSDFAFEVMKECVSETFNDISTFSEMMIVYSIFIRKYFSEVSEKVIPLLELVSEVISKAQNINDDDLQTKFLIFCSILLKNIFEVKEIDTSQLIEISFELAQKIVYFIDPDDVDVDQLENIIYLFTQIANINSEPFQDLSNDDHFINFFSSLLQNEDLSIIAKNFLNSYEIEMPE